MFDFHIHSRISFDSSTEPQQIVDAAVKAGLKEICFTDHLDYDPLNPDTKLTFDTDDYNAAYDHLHHPDLTIRRGIEFGMLPDNAPTLAADLKRRPFDMVIGSVHFVKGVDIYYPEFWQGKTVEQAETEALEDTLACVQAHDDFDVMGHLTYITKARANPEKRPVPYGVHAELLDEILRTLADKGKGIEVNTSGYRACGQPLPPIDYLRRFRQLGGQIVTVGSDAHTADRVGQHCHEICRAVQEIFGYVCTFVDRRPIFHKL